MSPTGSAVLDANVLLPMALCDTLLWAAQQRLYRPLWSEQILEEVRRNVVAKGFVSDEGVRRRIATMRAQFADAMVAGYERLIPAMMNDTGDRHVLAAAVVGGAQAIVTANIRHFPNAALTPYAIEVRTPDDFLCDLLDTDPEGIETAIRKQATILTRHPSDLSPIGYVLASLDGCGARRFVFLMRQRLR